jgi:DNA-directed RNA polymerase specialized sigma24 family protein
MAPGFETCWRDLEPQVKGMLLRRGVPLEVAEDVAQDAAIKLFRSWDRVDFDRPLWPLVKTTAERCLIDRYRGSRSFPVEEVPDAPADYDVEEHGLARVRLEKVARALATLRASDRATLLAEVGAAPRPQNSPASKMSRSRARQRLMKAMERVAAFAGGIQWRRAFLWIQSADGGGGMSSLAGVAATVIVIASAGSVAGHHPPMQPHFSRPTGATLVARRARGHHERRPPRPSVRRPAPKSAPAKDRYQPSTAPSQAPEAQPTSTGAGPARAETGRGKGYRYVAVCTSGESTHSDDQSVSVTYDDGTQDGDGPDPCRH